MGMIDSLFYGVLIWFIMPVFNGRFRRWCWSLGWGGKLSIISGLLCDLCIVVIVYCTFSWDDEIAVLFCCIFIASLLIGFVGIIRRMSEGEKYALTHPDKKQKAEYKRAILDRPRDYFNPRETMPPIKEDEWNTMSELWERYTMFESTRMENTFAEEVESIKSRNIELYDKLVERAKNKALRGWSFESIY